MRKTDVTQHAMFSYRSLEERIPDAHPLRKLRVLVDDILQSMSAEFEPLYSRRGRPSIAPERLLRASLIQTSFTIRSERQLVQHIQYNLLYRWFVGMTSTRRNGTTRPSAPAATACSSKAWRSGFFAQVLLIAERQELISDEHFTVDGTQIEAWASMKSFVKKDGGGTPPRMADATPPLSSRAKSALTKRIIRRPIRTPVCTRKAKATSRTIAPFSDSRSQHGLRALPMYNAPSQAHLAPRGAIKGDITLCYAASCPACLLWGEYRAPRRDTCLTNRA